jgi:hypothetical protein
VIRRLSLGGLMAVAALLGIAAIPAVSYSAQATEPSWLCSSSAAGCATLIVHPVTRGEKPGGPEFFPEEGAALRIAKLGSRRRCTGSYRRCPGKVLGKWYTNELTLRVAPGRYRITKIESASPSARRVSHSPSTEVSVRAGQTLDVTVTTAVI